VLLTRCSIPGGYQKGAPEKSLIPYGPERGIEKNNLFLQLVTTWTTTTVIITIVIIIIIIIIIVRLSMDQTFINGQQRQTVASI